MMRIISTFVFFLFAIDAGFAADPTPFTRLAGQWLGSGIIRLSDGSAERLRCRAIYDVLGAGNNVQLNIRCASANHNFDLNGNATYRSGGINGIWSESSMNTGGTLVGRGDGSRISALALGRGFSANLALTTRGNRQSVSIRSRNPQSTIVATEIDLRRR